MDVHQILRHNIEVHLARQHADQKDLAKFLGVTPGFISSVMSGRKMVPLNAVDRIAEFLKIPLSALFADPDAETKEPLPAESEEGNVVAPRRRRRSVAATEWDRLRHYQQEIKEHRATVQHYQQEIKATRASVRYYQQLLEREQAETIRLRNEHNVAEVQLQTLLEFFRTNKHRRAASAAHEDAQDPRPRGVHSRRTASK